MPRTYADLLKEARATRSARSPRPGGRRPAARRRRVVDVREDSEWEQGHLPDAVHISKSYVEQQIENAVPDRDTPVVLYCAGGVRSLFAAQTLEQLGYTNVASMSGGFQAWKSPGLPWETPVILSQEQKQRYSRHLLIPEVGAEGQQRAARVEGAAHRRRRSRLPGGALPRGRRRRHDRHRRLRRRRPVEPPAPDPAHERPGRRAQGRIGPEDAQCPEPRRERRDPRGDARRRQRRPDHQRLRRDHRRDRHVRDPLPPQRRGRREEHPGRSTPASSGSRAS